jgi:AhpC/TSA family
MTELTIIDGADRGRTATVPARLEAGAARLSRGALEQALGWALRPEGLCRGTVCVPVRHAAALETSHGVDLAGVAAALGRPLALDAEEGAAYLGVGPDERARSLAALEAPDFTLPDLEGRPHSLAEHRGKKVLLVAYASW